MASRRATARIAQTVAIALAAMPVLGLVVGFVRDDLGANPVETITHETGGWGLRFLLLSLAITPLRRLTGWGEIAGLRRTFGLIAFGYASLHFATFLALDLDFDPALLGEELRERPYITMGFAAFSLLVPLAMTSSRAAVRRLGRRWLTLHRLVYLAAACAIVHFVWLVKSDWLEPAIYGVVLSALLCVRIPIVARRLRPSRTDPSR